MLRFCAHVDIFVILVNNAVEKIQIWKCPHSNLFRFECTEIWKKFVFKICSNSKIVKIGKAFIFEFGLRLLNVQI